MEPDAQQREGERRTATVLFADISGFTAMSHKLDPEDVTVLMNGCFHALEEAVHAHGGIVDKYIGDCIMALWGVPRAVEDAPQRAINAAIDMRNRIERFGSDNHVSLELHVGINTGLVVAGEIGGARKRDFTVMGDTVNLAARLKDIAKNGMIYVGPQTYRYTRDAFEFRALSPVQVKGKDRPVSIYQVLSNEERMHRAKLATAPGMVSSAMVGRDGELGLLRECLARLADGQGGIVGVVGEAGLGKSRLLAEALALPEAARVAVIEARSVSIGQNLSYHPFIELLREWAGIGAKDAEGPATAKIERAIGDLLPEDANEIFPFVATLMGIRLAGRHAERVAGIGAEAMETWILRSMRAVLQRLAARKPLLLLLEDLHWADGSSLKLLESLLRLVGDTPLLFVFATRPDAGEGVARIMRAAREQYADRQVDIRLQPLDGKQCDRLIRNLLDVEDLPHATRELIARKAEGNPFFMEEVVRSLIDDGALVRRQGKLHLTGKIDSTVIPGTVQEVIMARIDRMEPTTRALLQVAAVIGRRFRLPVLSRVLEARQDLPERLGELVERQVVFLASNRQTATVRRQLLDQEREYLFQHALVQETIYESILQKTRRELHARVAAAIESLYVERLFDFYGMLAYHYRRAEIIDKAEEYLFKAGDEAAKSAASHEALEFFREASRLYFVMHGEGGDANKKALLERNIGMALLNTGNLSACIPHFSNALRLLGERVPQQPMAVYRQFATDLLAVLARLYLPSFRTRRVRDPGRVRQALAVMYSKARAQTTSDPQRFFFDTIHTIKCLNSVDPSVVEDACSMYAGSAALFCYSGLSFDLARRLLRQAETLVRPGNSADVFTHRSYVFVLNYLEGTWSDDAGIDDDLIRQALRFVRPWEVYTHLDLRCERHIYRGELTAAELLLAQIAEGSSVYGYDFAQSSLQGLTSIVNLERRRLDAALTAVDSYLDARHEALLNLRGLGNRAKILLLRGDRDAARETLLKAEALAARAGAIPPFHLSAYLMSRGLADLIEAEESLLAGGHRSLPSGLRRRVHRSVRAAVKISAKVARERTEAYTLAGRFHWLCGRRDRALQQFAAAIAEGVRLGARPALARTYVEVGERLAGESIHPETTLDGMDATTCFAKARGLFDAMGLDWDLARLAHRERAARDGRAAA